jgi:cadherin EGF LAG seven-pass G-type receptor 1
MPASMLKQIVYSNMELIKTNLRVHKISIYQDTSCAIEPCLNFQKCSTNVKFEAASQSFIESAYIQFRSIGVKHDFSCSCPLGFTGKNVSLMCDLEINLCYSNPCGQNGICVSLESDFRCICDPNFTGRMCEYNMKSTKCCELVEVPQARSLESKNKTRITINNCVTAKPSVYDFYSIELSNNRVCRGDSACKNLILGGVLCDKCGSTSHREDESYYNKFCELRARHFPEDSKSFLVFEGIRNRLRFKIKLSFATIKSDAFLFYNGILEEKNSQKFIGGLDFVQLEIRNEFLVFSYSLGDVLMNELILDGLSVSDGKWRTATIEYVDRNVTLSVDNDDLDHVDACEFARNKESLGSLECFRVNAYYNLPKKCENQIETCFRYFDLNGPFYLGRSQGENDPYYEGCISDFYLDDQMINLDEDVLLNYKTQIGCQPKVSRCKANDSKCSSCKHLWLDKFKCSNNERVDGEIYGFAGNGYLVMERDEIKTTSDLVIEFSVKFSQFSQRNKSTKIMRLESENFRLDLNYDSSNNTLSLTNINNEALIKIAKNDFLIGSYWNTIEIKISPKTNSVNLKVNDLFGKNFTSIKSQIETYSSWFMGGESISVENNLNGCIKNIKKNGVYVNPLEKINVSQGCPSGKISADKVKVCGINSPCYNNGTCSVDTITGQFKCACIDGFKGEFCQYKNKVSMKLFEKACPAKWWGKEPGICGPCECDESKNFSPDCVKNTGECQCKSKYYKTKEDRCVPCDCYLEGSTSLQCEPLTGQCPCLKGAGITGRRCDQCVAPLAEMTSKGNECRQLSSNECPRAFGFNVWWSRTPFNNRANSSCPKGSIGLAYRTCEENVGWLNDVDVSGCSSIKLIDSQLLKWSQELNADKSQLNSYQAFKLVDELNKLTMDADLDESNTNDLENQALLDSDMKNGHLSTSLNALYAIDLIVIKNLTQKILQYEIDNAPEFLYIQDKYFLTNIFSVLNVMLSKKYEIKFNQLKKRETSFSTNLTSYSSLTDVLIKLDTYLKLIAEHQQGYSLNENDVQINFPNVQMFMKTIQGQSFAEVTQNVKFKLLESSSETTSVYSNLISHKLAFVSLNGPSCNFPNELVTASYSCKYFFLLAGRSRIWHRVLP